MKKIIYYRVYYTYGINNMSFIDVQDKREAVRKSKAMMKHGYSGRIEAVVKTIVVISEGIGSVF